ncbi:MAG: hypothetical protein ABFD86_13575 [Bryobacteraceae bacterium]
MRPLALIASFAACLVLAGCGYVGEPMPPALNMPQKVAGLRAIQRGGNIIIEFTVPDRTTEDLPIVRLGEVELRVGPGGAQPFDFGRWCESALRIPVTASAPGPVEVTTPIRNWAGQDVLFAVRASKAKGRFSDWAGPNVLHVVEPVLAPKGLRAEAVSTGVKLSWQAARQALGFRVYRRAEGEKEDGMVAESAASGWIDTSTVYGKRYDYRVQAVVKTGESVAESEISPPVEIVTADKFPPAVPVGLSAASTPESVELTWERNTEPDFAFYRVYRSLDGTAFEKIADSLQSPSYSDHTAARGKQYRYMVSAVDLLGNESARSQPVEAGIKQ